MYIKVLWDEVAVAQESHEDCAAGLQAELQNLSSKFKSELKRRGTRNNGTHEAWFKGLDSPDSDWYRPFSMANDGDETKRYFPVTRIQIGAKISSLLKLFRSIAK